MSESVRKGKKQKLNAHTHAHSRITAERRKKNPTTNNSVWSAERKFISEATERRQNKNYQTNK